jgi:hypothetical protein
MGKISGYANDSTPNVGDKLIGTDVNDLNATKNFTIGQILSLGASSGLLVPYTGATGPVNLGVHNISANSFIKAGGTSSQFLKADGSVDSNTYLTSAAAIASYVPYTGATVGVNLGSNSITANSFIKVGGTSSQFLKADGSVDSTTYATAASVTALAPKCGSFYDTTTQTALVANTAYPIKLNSTDNTATNGFGIANDGLGNPTLIKASATGVYNIAFSAQLRRTSGGSSETVNFWFKRDGAIVSWSNTSVTVQANAGLLVAAWNFFVQMDAGTEVQLMWATTATSINIQAALGASPHPETPSVILTVNKVG